MNKLRKFLVVSVMVMTSVVMSGLMSAAPAQAAASAGDLIKMEGLSSVYYLGEDGKRYVFPNESTYFSWYADFSGVVTIPASELQSYPLGGNVTMRPGTTLVKITTDPSVYAVEPNGMLRKIANEAQAASLYGTNWNKRIVDLADSFFTNYTIGSPLADGQIPVGSLVKNAGSATVYYWDGTNYRTIASEAAMAANRLLMKNVLTVTNTLTAGGTAITGMEAGLVKTSQGATTGPVITGSGLMVSLNAMTPISASVPQNGSRVPMAKVNLTAANDGAVSVNSITIKRIGLSTYDNIDKVWAEKDGVIVASKKSMNSSDETILTFSPALIVNAGQTVALDFITSLKLNGSGVAAGNIGLSIASASAVSATAASITGSFPVNGNLMSATNYSVVDLSFVTSTVSANVKVGDEKVELGRFTVGTTKDVVLNSITVKNNGIEDLSKTTMNLYLESAGNKVSANTIVDGRFVTFYFPAAYELTKNDTSRDFYIKGDIIAKENSSGPSFSLVLNKSTDLVAYEKATGFGANVNVADGYAISSITIDAGAISVSKKSSSPADTNIVKGSDNTVLIANVRADEAITVDGLNIIYYSTTTAATTDQFENVRVYVNGALLDSFDPSASSTATLSKNIDSTFTLKKGDNEIKVMVKAKTNANSGSKFVAKLDGGIAAGKMFYNMNPEYIVSGNPVTGTVSGTATGGTFTVQGATLTTVRNDGYGLNKTIVQGSTDVSLGKFTVKASNDTVKVTSISFGSNAFDTAASSIYDMKLFVDGAQIGNTLDFGTSGVTFSSLNFNIAKDSTKSIELKGAFDSTATGNFETLMTINAQDSRGTSIVGGNKASTTKFALAEAGSLTVAVAGDSPVAGLLASKTGVEQEVAQFKFTAVNDSANLTEINIENSASTTKNIADARIAAIKLYDGSTLLDQFVPVDGTGKFTLNNNVVIAANNSKTLSVKVVLNNIDNDADATDKPLAIKVTTVKAKSSSGAENPVDVNKAASEFIIRKTVPTVAYQELSDKVLAAGDKTIAKFTVTADSNGDVTVKKIVLNVATSTLATIAETTNTLRINGSNKTATTVITSGKMTITLDGDGEIIAAGATKTFEVRALLGVGGSGSESVTASIVEDEYLGIVADGNFVWSDGASISNPTYANGFNVKGLSTDTWTLSK